MKTIALGTFGVLVLVAALAAAQAPGQTEATPGAATTAEPPPAPLPAETAPAATAPPATVAAPAPAAPASPLRRPAGRAKAARRLSMDAPAKPAPAPTSTTAEAPLVDVELAPRVPAAPIPRISAWLGAGSLWLPSEGLDAFADDDALMTFSAGAALAVISADALGIAAVAAIDVTSSDADLRGSSTSLGLLRLSLGPELRSSILDRLYWHARLSPTLTRLSAELDDGNDLTLTDRYWVWGAEATVGVDLRFIETPMDARTALGFFVRVEAGYAWAPASQLALESDGSGAPVRTQPLQLGELALAGPLLRGSLGIGF